VQAFFRDQNFQADLKITADNYSEIEENVGLTIQMQEVTDGLPTFYLVLGIGLVISISGSLGLARYVRYLRIPGFVKKIHSVRKTIKKGNPMSDERITMTKDEQIVDKYGKYWKEIKLDPREIFGIIEDQSNNDDALTLGDAQTGGV
jgi:hypothetical protein